MKEKQKKDFALISLPHDLMRRVEVIADASSLSADALVNQIVQGFVFSASCAAEDSDGFRLRGQPVEREPLSSLDPSISGLADGGENAEKSPDY